MKQTATQKNGKNLHCLCVTWGFTFPYLFYILFPSIFLTLALKNTIKENLQIQHQLKKKIMLWTLVSQVKTGLKEK